MRKLLRKEIRLCLVGLRLHEMVRYKPGIAYDSSSPARMPRLNPTIPHCTFHQQLRVLLMRPQHEALHGYFVRLAQALVKNAL